jgi:hypothetical protein
MKKITSCGDKGGVIAERHERLRQLSEVSFDGAGDGLVLPLEPILQVEFVHFPPVQAHGQQLVDLGRDAHQSIKSLILQAAVLQLADARADEVESDLVQARLFVFR